MRTKSSGSVRRPRAGSPQREPKRRDSESPLKVTSLSLSSSSPAVMPDAEAPPETIPQTATLLQTTPCPVDDQRPKVEEQRPAELNGVSELMADALTLNRRVWYRGTVPCTVRYVGQVRFARGEWVGIEREDEGQGKHDGTVDGVTYFTTLRLGKNALFVIPPMLSLRPVTPSRDGVVNLKPSMEHILNANCRIHLMSAKLLGFHVSVESHYKGHFARGRNRVYVTQAQLSTLTSKDGVRFCEDKHSCSRALAAGGIPVPRNEMLDIEHCKDFDALLDTCTIPYPLVIKTNWGYGGDGVFPYVADRSAAVGALSALQEKGAKRVLVEDRITGDDYRVLLLDGIVRDVVLRRPAAVVGDGVHTLGELITAENGNRQVVGRHMIIPDEHYMRTHALSMDFVPTRDASVRVQDKCNMALGGTTTRIDQATMHESTLSMLRSIARLLPPGQRICGVDYMTTDITSDYRVSNSMINEINATPSIDVHFYCDFERHHGDWSIPHYVTYSAASWASP